MSAVNRLLVLIDKPQFRLPLKLIIWINYKRKGINIEKIKFLNDFHKWYYKVNGISFLSSGAGWSHSFEYLLSELKNISGYYYMPKDGDVIVDIGAGIGEETIVYSKAVGKTGHVFSIEANPNTYNCLKFITNDNQLSNVSLFNCAISDNDGVVTIEDNPEDYLGNAVGGNITKENSFTVEGYQMDTFIEFNKIKTIDFLKVNIEGAEQLLVKGLNKYATIIQHGAISCHDFRYAKGESEFFKTKSIIVNYLNEHGFKIQIRQTGNDLLDNYVYFSR